MTIHITGRHMDTGEALRAHVETRLDEAVHKYFVYASFEQSVGKIEKQLRRYKRRLKSHADHMKLNDVAVRAPEKIIEPETEGDVPADFTPVIVAENNRAIPYLTMSEAVMQLEVGTDDFVLFKSRKSDALNMVYKRADHNIGWLELNAA